MSILLLFEKYMNISIPTTWWLDVIDQQTHKHVDPSIARYFIEKIRHPDLGSDFESLTKPLRDHCPEDMWILKLIENNYRVYSLKNSEENNNLPVKWFMALQVHDDIAKVFRFEVEEPFRWKKLSVNIAISLINTLKTDWQISKIQIGKWPNDIDNPDGKAVQLVARLADIADNTGITVDIDTHTISR